ncbi:MAG: class I mannose-6-phosphate isomerase [Clostridia bacterium]|nr:class I mannose-6-phosphate isomerase [Clostridia bacterium]
MNILKLKPALKDYLWGGTRLKTEFKMESDLSKVAEAWVLSTHKDGPSVVENGVFKGKTFNQALELLGKEALGEKGGAFEFFPILIKLIDAKDKLSVQVHPEDEYALKTEGEYGKTEMWYIVDCEEGATLYFGFKEEISKEEFRRRIEDNTLTEVLNSVPVKKGDVFFIEAGTIHAIGSGILIAEIQQNSNTTYRVSDYGRLGADGKPRPLHIEKALEVTKLKKPSVQENLPSGVLACCKYFNVKLHNVDGGLAVKVGKESFSSLLVLEGEITVEDVVLKKGECCFIPANSGEIKITGKANVIESRV